MPARNLFVSREGGAVVRVTEVNESYAIIVGVSQGGHYQMPVREYDGGNFVRGYRPATEEDLERIGQPGDSFRLPADAPVSWGGTVPDDDIEVGEDGEEQVKIGAD